MCNVCFGYLLRTCAIYFTFQLLVCYNSHTCLPHRFAPPVFSVLDDTIFRPVVSTLRTSLDGGLHGGDAMVDGVDGTCFLVRMVVVASGYRS
ncbi:hypothetical protein QVD17_10178 [Tagetes erecta]|uniref:Uncharacterized protein n=1 Tax=Tagetes erecta TaxID=13708 RepID=A0AAD8L2T9_TARER|nr:hypothetical protein QVD17_10178 [Tagetes erecta]